MNSWKIILVLLYCSCTVLLAKSPDAGLFSDLNHESFLPRDEIERNAILLGENFVNKILAQKDFSLKDEQELFGPYGGILGESLYTSLGYVSSDKSRGRCIVIDASVKLSPLGALLIRKLSPIFANKKRFTYCLGRNIYTYDRNGIVRAGTTAVTFLFLQAIPESSSAFHDNANGIIMVIALRYSSNKKKRFYIDLVDSYIGHIPLYKFLGFQGKFASDLKLSDGELLQLKKYLRKESSLRTG